MTDLTYLPEPPRVGVLTACETATAFYAYPSHPSRSTVDDHRLASLISEVEARRGVAWGRP